MGLVFGWNAFMLGREVDFAQAAQGASFVYFGADEGFPQAQALAQKANLKVGAYWSLKSGVSPADQVQLFLSRIGAVLPAHLPPAVWVYPGTKLATVKSFVELLEAQLKPRRVLIGGTPRSLEGAGLLFGRTNPLWINHKPIFGGPSIPKGWDNFAVWQTNPEGLIKGVSGTVGHNGAQTWFIDPNVHKRLATNILFAGLFAGGIYLYTRQP